ncbi:MAG: aklaviketone reductase [Labilithrix sp.]|nr:aklaviketone reductase [Labilithrix sp.]
MKVVVIGATGTIGSAVVQALEGKHQVVRASRHGAARVDITDPTSVRALFTSLKGIDAIVCCAGEARFGDVPTLTDSDLDLSGRSKLMGQVNVVRHGLPSLADKGSITLTSGILARHPMRGSAAVGMVNAGIEGFVRCAALETVRGVRINVVSPGWVKETMVKMGMDPSSGMSASEIARVYLGVLEGTMNGQTVEPRSFGALREARFGTR